MKICYPSRSFWVDLTVPVDYTMMTMMPKDVNRISGNGKTSVLFDF